MQVVQANAEGWNLISVNTFENEPKFDIRFMPKYENDKSPELN